MFVSSTTCFSRLKAAARRLHDRDACENARSVLTDSITGVPGATNLRFVHAVFFNPAAPGMNCASLLLRLL